jgi:hypothetical protein
MVAYACNPIYLRYRSEGSQFQTSPGKKLMKPISTNKLNPSYVGHTGKSITVYGLYQAYETLTEKKFNLERTVDMAQFGRVPAEQI